MKKLFTALLIVTLTLSSSLFFGCGGGSNVISVCASDVPHAEVLNGVVKEALNKKGFVLKVKILDWTMQNDGVANGDYDANYFQHVPYLETYQGRVKLFASCKVHYEPLGIYYGKAQKGTPLSDGKTFSVCNDTSNAIRAFELLEAKGVISKTIEGDNYPVKENGDELNIVGASSSWKSKDGKITVTLITENTLVTTRKDYDFTLLPCNTAHTGNIPSSERIAVEDDPAQVSLKANVIAARLNDYRNDPEYKAKIDALTEVMLSKAVSEYFQSKYLGAMTCDSTTQIDLRSSV